jgi:hypothetical protein
VMLHFGPAKAGRYGAPDRALDRYSFRLASATWLQPSITATNC